MADNIACKIERGTEALIISDVKKAFVRPPRQLTRVIVAYCQGSRPPRWVVDCEVTGGNDAPDLGSALPHSLREVTPHRSIRVIAARLIRPRDPVLEHSRAIQLGRPLRVGRRVEIARAGPVIPFAPRSPRVRLARERSIPR